MEDLRVVPQAAGGIARNAKDRDHGLADIRSDDHVQDHTPKLIADLPTRRSAESTAHAMREIEERGEARSQEDVVYPHHLPIRLNVLTPHPGLHQSLRMRFKSLIPQHIAREGHVPQVRSV